MPLKRWILDKLHRLDGLLGRPDLPSRAGEAVEHRAGNGGPPAAAAAPQPPVDHLGPYAPLIEAIRQELQQFVDGPLRLHLAIAELDRFMLQSIDIGCEDDPEALELLRRFVQEFKPDQIRRFLRRDVISALPNATAIDLSQFTGLRVLLPQAGVAGEAGDEYAELLAELRQGTAAVDVRGYALSLTGRWVERDGSEGAGDRIDGHGAPAPQTPLAGQRLEIEVQDGRGRRDVAIEAVVAGRRYSIGKAAGCDIPVEGTYASRRHAEIWSDQGAWWLLDTGSTNGVRVEGGSKGVARSGSGAAGGERPIRLPPGARIVLSALTEGSTADYPALTLRTGDAAATASTPIAGGAPTTPITPVVPPPGRGGVALRLTAQMESGERSALIDAAALPFGIGRSRNQALAVDLVHATVSGRHLEIVACDAEGAEVVVHGDNGVIVDGTEHPAGSRLRWQVGQGMLLGRALPNEPPCRLQLGTA